MSLNWDTTKVADAKAIGVGIDPTLLTDADKLEWAKTEHIIFASLVTGLGKTYGITEENHVELFVRFSAYEHAVDGPVTSYTGEGTKTVKHWLTLEDIRKRIGLRTNASPLTDAQFERRLGQILLDAARRLV
jgi:hypothetical protein